MNLDIQFLSENAESTTHQNGWTVSYEDQFSVKYKDGEREKVFEIEENVDAEGNLLTTLFLDTDDFAQYAKRSREITEIVVHIRDALSFLNSKYSETPGQFVLEITRVR